MHFLVHLFQFCQFLIGAEQEKQEDEPNNQDYRQNDVDFTVGNHRGFKHAVGLFRWYILPRIGHLLEKKHFDLRFLIYDF